jgi:hypothetical protein
MKELINKWLLKLIGLELEPVKVRKEVIVYINSNKVR